MLSATHCHRTVSAEHLTGKGESTGRGSDSKRSRAASAVRCFWYWRLNPCDRCWKSPTCTSEPSPVRLATENAEECHVNLTLQKRQAPKGSHAPFDVGASDTKRITCTLCCVSVQHQMVLYTLCSVSALRWAVICFCAAKIHLVCSSAHVIPQRENAHILRTDPIFFGTDPTK